MWQDITPYDKYDKEHTPTTWLLKLSRLRVVVTCDHIYYKGVWVMHCDPFYNTFPLDGVITRQEAQARAVALVRERLDEIIKALDEASKE